MKIIRTLAVAAGLAGLTLAGVTPAHALFSEPLPMGDWSNVSAPVAAANNAGITFKLAQTSTGLQATGFDGCNYYSAPAERAGETEIHLGSFRTTRMACDYKHAAAETAFVAAFQNKTTAFDTGVTTMTLQSTAGTWSFARVGTPVVDPQLQGTWRLQPAASTVAGLGAYTPLMTIGQDASVKAATACNTFTATALADSHALRMANAGTTRMLCDDNARMTAETAYAGALESVYGWRIVDGRLLLDAPAGTLAYTAA